MKIIQKITSIAITVLIMTICICAKAQCIYTEEDIVAICKSAVAGEGIAKEQLDDCQYSIQPYSIRTSDIETEKWMVSFQENAVSEDDFAFAIFSLPSGVVLTSNRDRNVFSVERQRLEWEVRKGLYAFWTVEDKAKFNQEVSTPLGYKGSAMMPDNAAVQQDDAVQIANNELINKFHLSTEMIDECLPDIRFFSYEGILSWIIALHSNTQTRQETFPVKYTVVVDSMTGTVLDIDSY